LRVPILAASGGGLFAIVTHASGGFHSVSSRFRSPAFGCQSAVALVCVASQPCGMSGVRGGSTYGPSTLWRSEVVVLVAHPLLPLAWGSSSRELGVGRVAEVAMAPCVVSSSESERCVQLPCKSCARAAVCCSCCCAACVASVVARRVRALAARLALDSLAVVFLMVCVAFVVCVISCLCTVLCSVSIDARAKQMFCVPCCIAGRALRHLPMVVVGLVLAGCELWLRCIAWLPCVLVRSALCSFRVTVVLPLWFEVCRLVGLHSVCLGVVGQGVVRLAIRLAVALVSSPCCSFLSFSAASVGLRVLVA
ncbi:hypothetical protein Taro_045670, partial [Colocasia esculenta]|nr:hypothetical protein [Colocasia esculenta]